MDDQRHLIAGARPGDMLSYVEVEGRAPAVGTRMTIFAVRDAGTRKIVGGHRANDDGPWEVIRVGPSGTAEGMVTVHIRRR